MLTEDYCSYKVSKLLNEKGLNGMCDTVIGRDGTKYDIKLYDYVEEETTSCPTHQMAMKWLREIYGLHISGAPYLNEEGEATWVLEVINIETAVVIADSLDLDDNFSSYEEAVEAALKYCLTKLI